MANSLNPPKTPGTAPTHRGPAGYEKGSSIPVGLGNHIRRGPFSPPVPEVLVRELSVQEEGPGKPVPVHPSLGKELCILYWVSKARACRPRRGVNCWGIHNPPFHFEFMQNTALAPVNSAQAAINFGKTAIDSPIGGDGSDGHFGNG